MQIFIEIFLQKPAGSHDMNGNPVVIFRNFRKESTAFTCPFTRPILPSTVLSMPAAKEAVAAHRHSQRTAPTGAGNMPFSIRPTFTCSDDIIPCLHWIPGFFSRRNCLVDGYEKALTVWLSIFCNFILMENLYETDCWTWICR